MNQLIRLFVIFFFIGNSANAYEPKIFVHRGGAQEFPENTIRAFEESLKEGADGIELDVQLTKDNVVILYHPRAISNKKISEVIFAELQKINPQTPTLEEIIDKFSDIEIIVDLKSMPAKDLVDAVIKLVDRKNAWSNLIFYSTNDEHINYLKEQKPEAMVFENRALTRERLLKVRNENICCCLNKATQYAGFELSREMVVEEEFALGKSSSRAKFKLWDVESMQCFNNSLEQPVRIFLFGTLT